MCRGALWFRCVAARILRRSLFDLDLFGTVEMDKVFRAATTLGTGAVVAGIASEFFLYDGE